MRDDINRLRASVDSYLEREAWDDALDDLQVLWRLLPTQATAGTVASAEALAAARTRVVDEFRSYVTSFRSRSQAQLIVHGLECLPVAQTGILDHQGPSGQIETTQLINHDLMRLCKQEGAYFLDYDGLVARYGRRLWLDERRWLDARLPIASAALPSLADEWLRFICPIAGRSAKCLVCDLDNTLWGGVIGEDGYDGIKLDGEY